MGDVADQLDSLLYIGSTSALYRPSATTGIQNSVQGSTHLVCSDVCLTRTLAFQPMRMLLRFPNDQQVRNRRNTGSKRLDHCGYRIAFNALSRVVNIWTVLECSLRSHAPSVVCKSAMPLVEDPRDSCDVRRSIKLPVFLSSLKTNWSLKAACTF
jgi:hypothetical protein